MDIKLSHSLLSEYLSTKTSPKEIANCLSLCGPTVDKLHDSVYDIEIITNRIDSVSALGVAREAAAILPQFKHPAKLKNDSYKLKLSSLGKLPSSPPLKLVVKDKGILTRFACIALKNVTIKPSDTKTQNLLKNHGLRPLNNVVDISNEITLRLGQPVHVFDLDKIKGKKMTVRYSRSGEKITTLDGKTHLLKGKDIIIEDGEGRLIDLAGIMGGSLSEVDSKTKNVLYCIQVYQPQAIRRTSLYLQQRTLASQIFEKIPDPDIVIPALIEGTQMLQKRAGGVISSNLLDYYPKPLKKKIVTIDLNWLNRFVGIIIPPKQVISILKTLGFIVKRKSSSLTCQVPSWRHQDISIKQDLAEEIARVYGYFRLPSNLPTTQLKSFTQEPLLYWETQTKKILSLSSFTEIYNSSLVSEKLFSQVGLEIKPSLKIKNPLTQDQAYLRRSLIPQILDNLSHNQPRIKQPLRIFELSNIYLPQNKNLPEEHSILVYATDNDDYRHHKGYFEHLAKKLHLKNLNYQTQHHSSPLWNQSQTVEIYSGKTFLGLIGKIKSQVCHQLKLKGNIYLTNLDFQVISELASNQHNVKSLIQHAPIIEDINFSSTTPVNNLIKKIKDFSPQIQQVTYIDSYKDKHTFRVIFNDPKKSLTQKQVNSIKEKLLQKLTSKKKK